MLVENVLKFKKLHLEFLIYSPYGAILQGLVFFSTDIKLLGEFMLVENVLYFKKLRQEFTLVEIY